MICAIGRLRHTIRLGRSRAVNSKEKMKSLAAPLFVCAGFLFASAPLQAATAAVKTAKAPVSASSNAAARLKQIADDYYISTVTFEPMNATFFGDHRFDDQLGLSIAPKNRAALYADLRKFSARLKAIDPGRLARADRISYQILDYDIRTDLAGEAYPDHLLPINQLETMPVALANFASGKSSQPLATPAQYRAYLNRVKQLTPWIEQAIANMRTGMRTGVVLPKALIVSTLPQYQKLPSATAETNIFYTPITNLPADFSAEDKQALTAAYAAEITGNLNPALARLAAFLENEYLPAGRASAGLGALPNGRNWYLRNVAWLTTTSMTPDEIHRVGLKEVARIQQEFALVGPKLGYDGPPAGLPQWVAAQEKFRPFKRDEDILEVYRKLDKELDNKLPALFTLLPKAPLEERLEPELTRASASDHYTAPNAAAAAPGIFWTVVNDPTKYMATKMTTLFLHEGRPGHHFQIALQLEMDLPDFRKFGGNNAYIEGWALYAESLGKEMNLYQQPDQYFGHLNDELLRAVRLVVDTGLHAKGWSREQAIQYLRDTNGYTEAVARIAAERYMGWPGQALGYKIGALKIAELRQRAAAAMGPKFSLPAFHAIVLRDATVPLAILEQSVDEWIAQSK
jgi:uncharacterized protein (DUF885 family)